jgi:hypothetical protein
VINLTRPEMPHPVFSGTAVNLLRRRKRRTFDLKSARLVLADIAKFHHRPPPFRITLDDLEVLADCLDRHLRFRRPDSKTPIWKIVG